MSSYAPFSLSKGLATPLDLYMYMYMYKVMEECNVFLKTVGITTLCEHKCTEDHLPHDKALDNK